jgi:hypothetical protein
VRPKWRAVIVYLTDVEPDSQISGRDLEALHNVLISASRYDRPLRTVAPWMSQTWLGPRVVQNCPGVLRSIVLTNPAW